MTQYYLQVTISPAGTGSVQPVPMGDYSAGKVYYDAGTIVNLTPYSAVYGYVFDHWEGSLAGSNVPGVLTMNANKAVTAVFKQVVQTQTAQLSTSVAAGQGSISPASGVYNLGDQIIIVASPASGYKFKAWSGDISGAIQVPGMPNNLQVVMDRDRHISAEFEAAPVEPPDPDFADLQVVSWNSPVAIGGYCYIRVKFQYVGPAIAKTLYAAIGKVGILGFDEILHAAVTLSLQACYTWQNFTADISVPITNGLTVSGSPYSLYSKLTGTGPDIISPTKKDILYVNSSDPVQDPEYRNLLITAWTQEEVGPGDNCRIAVNFDYRGPAASKTLYAAIGRTGLLGFDEHLTASKSIQVAASSDWTSRQAEILIPVTDSLAPEHSPYDIYAKLTGDGNDLISPTREDVILVKGAGFPDPEFKDLEITAATSPVNIGATCWIDVKFKYRGPERSETLYAAIGKVGILGFDEILHGSGSMSLPAAADFTEITSKVAIAITDDIDPFGGPYDGYFKIAGVVSSSYSDLVEVNQGDGTGIITGVLTHIEPLSFKPGASMTFLVSFNAYCDDWWQQLNGWFTRVTINLGGELVGHTDKKQAGRDGTTENLEVYVGDMPERNLAGSLVLEGAKNLSSSWEVLDTRDISVTVTAAGGTPETNGGVSSGLTWLAAGALFLVALATGEKPSGKKKSKAK